jgi:glycosyltransferase involved in cell wall biosynthesis
VAELLETAPRAVDPRLAGLRRIAIVPAFNEEESITRVIEEIRAFDPELEIVVVDDGSRDRTAVVAEQCGAHVVRLPFNLGIGGAVQTGFRYAFENGFRIAVRLDGDGQHDASQLGLLLEPVLADEADIAVGSRFAVRGGAGGLADGASSPGDGYRSSRPRRAGITILASTVSLLVRRRVTDPTSGFQALNRHAIGLFAADYPHDIPEVEAVLMVHRHRLRMVEVPVQMRERVGGRSSIGRVFAVYYMVKVLLALFVGLFRKNVTPLEDIK